MSKMRFVPFFSGVVLCLSLSLNTPVLSAAAQGRTPGGPQPAPIPLNQTPSLFLPLIRQPAGVELPSEKNPRINLPAFPEGVVYGETALLWFGQVNSASNYTDVRMGYTPGTLWVNLAVFDRYVWTNDSPKDAPLVSYDAAALYLQTEAGSTYRFTAQTSWVNNNRPAYQAAEVMGGSGWAPAALPFETEAGWRGNAPNDGDSDRGWTMLFEIPFASLGLAAAPTQGTLWNLGFEVYDRDDAAATPRPIQRWPAGLDPAQPESWGQLHFGLPGYTPPAGLAPAGTTVIRHGLDGVTVTDGMVGGGTTCGQGLDYWTEWGDANRAGEVQVNVQNQNDVADWPCFAKDYLTFPLNRLPDGAQIISADLTLNQFGNAGGGQWGEPPVSLLQIFTVAEDWQEETLTWNNAPLALENVSRARVDPILSPPPPQGIARTWDVSRAVAQALAAGQTSLRLAIYSADGPYHSGKYFFFSEVGDWNAAGRPTLRITWGIK